MAGPGNAHDRDARAAERFEQLFRSHHRAVAAYARRRAPGDTSDDVVASTFLVAWRRVDEVPADSLPWLLAVARNVIATQQRGSRRRGALRLRLERGDGSTTPRSAVEEPAGQVAAALGRLPANDREAITLIAWDGLRPAEAATVLGQSPAAFRVRLHRAKRRLRRELDRGRAGRPAPPTPIRSQGDRPMTTTPPTHEGDLMELVRGADPLAGDVDPATDAAAESLLREILAAPRQEPLSHDPAGHEGGRSSRRRGGRRRGCRRSDHRHHRRRQRRGRPRLCRGRPARARRRYPAAPARSCMSTYGEPRTTATAPRSPGGTRAGRRTALPMTAARSRPTRTARPSRAGTWAIASRCMTPPPTRSMPADRPRRRDFARTARAAPSRRHGTSTRISPGPTANTYTVRLMVFRITPGHGYKIVPGRGRQYRLVITRSQAKALKNSSSIIKWVRAPRGAGTLNGYRPAVVPAPAAATAPDCSDFGSQDYGDQILTLLRSCGAHLVGHATSAAATRWSSGPRTAHHLLR